MPPEPSSPPPLTAAAGRLRARRRSRRRGSRSRAGAALVVALLLLPALSTGCDHREAGPPELETEVVEPPPDADLATEGDQRERPGPDAGVAGVLPGGFPSGLPVFKPSSIVDFGHLDDGRAYVLFFAAAPPARVEERLLADLRAAGWSHGGAAGGVIEARRGARRVELRVTATGGGSEIRVAYPV